jgi:uncharacterized protein (TIGR02145 family)
MKNFLRTSFFFVFCLGLTQIFNSCKKEKVPALTTSEITNISESSATSGGTITDEGSGTIIDRGVCWTKGISPTIEDSKTNDGAGTGTFQSSMSNLDAGTTYYVRAYATNNAGTNYGMVMSFTTLGQVPVAVTLLPTGLTSSGVILNGAVNANYLSTTIVFDYGTTLSYGSSITALQSPVDGNTSSDANTIVSGLDVETTYHYRIKAVNSLGVTYGDDKTFVLPSPISDIDANIYQTVTIGTQTWMAENLKVTKYNDAVPLPLIIDNAIWTDLATPGYGWYDNNVTYKDTYGALYNWFIVDASSNGNKNVCPTDWHVPTDAEWTTLTDYLGGLSMAGGKLKETGTTHWTSPNAGATNETGFTALPSGNRAIHGWSGDIQNKTYWWSVSEYDVLNAWFIGLDYSGSSAIRDISWKKVGFPIRCLRD